MRLPAHLVLTLFVWIGMGFLFPRFFPAHAAVDCQMFAEGRPSLTAPVEGVTLSFNKSRIQDELKKSQSGGQLKVSLPNTSCSDAVVPSNPAGAFISVVMNKDDGWFAWCDDDMLSPGDHEVKMIYAPPNNQPTVEICSSKTYTITSEPSSCSVTSKFLLSGNVDDKSRTIDVSDISLASQYNGIVVDIDTGVKRQIPGNPTHESFPYPGAYSEGTHTAVVYPASCIQVGGRGPGGVSCSASPSPICTTSFYIAQLGESVPSPTPTPTRGPLPAACTELLPDGSRKCDNTCSGSCAICPQCQAKISIPPILKLKPLCEQLDNAEFQEKCLKCVTAGANGVGGIWTAIGCLPTNYTDLINKYIFTTGLGLAGVVAFLYLIYGSFLILTSTGNPEIVAHGKEVITSAISGLILIIFSVFLLRTIGVDILKIPGFE